MCFGCNSSTKGSDVSVEKITNKEFLKVINNKVKQFEREDLKKSFKVLKGGKDVKVVFLNKKLK